MGQLARPFCVNDGATTNCQIGPAPENRYPHTAKGSGAFKIPYSHQEIQAPHCEKGSSG
jgi:hypothetical protein